MWLAALVAAAAVWPVRRLGPWARAGILPVVAAFAFVLPMLFPREPVLLRVVVVLMCPTIGAKLLSLGVEAAWWERARFGDWIWFLVVPFILVPRLHAGAPVGVAGGGVRWTIRGVYEVAAGAALLWWAFGADLGRWSFWVDHTVKLLGAYLCVLDGMFVLGTGLLRLAGVRVLDLSRDPIASVTPADFWRRYNCEAGRFLREDVFKPLCGRIGAGPAIGATFLINGMLHEYLAWLMVGRVQGYQMAFFAVQGAAVVATWRLRPRRTGLWRAGTLAFVVATSVLFFASVQQFVPLYSRGGILP